MAGNDDNATDVPKASLSTGTVALSGYMVGPNGENYEFELTHPLDPSRRITVEWRDIRWIDAYPHPPAGETDGNVPHHLGRRTIWLDAGSDLVREFLNGVIVDFYVPPGDNLAGWNGPVMFYGAGPMGSTYPPCICPK